MGDGYCRSDQMVITTTETFKHMGGYLATTSRAKYQRGQTGDKKLTESLRQSPTCVHPSTAMANITDYHKVQMKTRSSWLNCALRDDEAVYWVSIGHYEEVAVGN